MAVNPGSTLQVSRAVGQHLTDAQTGDVVFRTDTSNQRLLLAAGSNVAAAVAVASNAVRFSKDVFIDSGRLDVAAGSNLNIGANAAVINLGSASATVNIMGAVTQVTSTQTTINDPIITLNRGGAASTGAGVGVEVEEAGAAAGYVKTATNRAGWEIKAPSSAGVATIVPGAAGITLNQSSHDPLSLASAASNGLSITGQVLSLGVASITAPGALAATDFASFSNKVDASLLRQIGSNIGVNAHMVPTSNVTFDLGSEQARFRDLYLSGNTINLGGTKISTDATTGDIKLIDGATQGLKRLVVDELQIGDTTVDANVFKITRSNGKVQIQQSNSSSGVMSDSNTVIDNLFAMSNRIGIGKTAPAYALDVAGDVNFSGALRSNGALYVSSQFTVANTSNVFLATGSNLGLGGKSNPAFALDVSGDVNFTGALRSNGVLYPSSRFTLASASNVFLATGSNLGLGGKSNPAFALDVAGDVNFSGILRSNGAPYVGSQFTTSNTTNVFLPSGSNLGLGGKSNPGYTLDVNGGVNVSDGFYINGVPFTGGAGGGSGTIVTSAGIQSVAADQVLMATQLQQVTASNAIAGFGLGARGALAVASSNASMMIAGAASSGVSGTGSAVFYYRATGATGTWTELQRVFGTGASNAMGSAVAMSPDGTAAAVASATQVLVYTCAGTGSAAIWSQAGSALAVSGAASLSLSAIDGSNKYYLAIGQSAASQTVIYYGGTGATWTQQGSALTGTAATLFGTDVAVSADGIHLVVGAPAAANATTGIQNTGAAVFYKRTGTSWASVGSVYGEANGDQFGTAVAVSGSAGVAAVGAPRATHTLGIQTGAVYPFAYDGSAWALQGSGKLVGGESASGDQLGSTVALDIAGFYIVAGSIYDTTAGGLAAGSVSLFLRAGNNWSFVSTITARNAAVNTGFGQHVALAQASGQNYVAVAAPAATTNVTGAGAVFWFSLAATPYQWNSASGLASVATQASRVQLGSNSAVVVDAANTRLGVGKSNPAWALDVVGDVNFTGQLRSNGAPYISSQFTTAANGVYIAGGSNVAVGTSTVSAARALYVAGDMEATGKLYAGASFAALSNLPTAASYPGMTAFVSATGLLYVSDGTAWVAQASSAAATAAVAKAGDSMTGDLLFSTGKGIDATGALNVGVSNATTLNLGTSAATTTVNIGTGAGATTINLGAAGDTVNVAGTLAYINTTNLTVTDKLVTLNKGGAAASGFTTGLEIEENATATGYVRTDGTGTAWQVKAPAAAGVMTLDAGASNLTVSAATMWSAGMSNGTVYRMSNVGVGKSNPAWALDVVGDVNFTGTLRSNGAAYVSSQFSVANTSNVFLATGSNLGLGGKSNPVFPLDVAGDINFSGILRSNGAAYVGSQFSTSNTSNVILATGSNLGLGGKTNPAFPLDVAGDINFSGILRSNGAAYVSSQFSTASTSNVFLAAGSNLGLGGKSNPGYTLDVAGDVNISGAFRVNGSNAALPLGALPRRNYVRTGFMGATAAGSYGVSYTTLSADNAMAGVYINYTANSNAGDSFTVLADGVYSVVAQAVNDGPYANLWLDKNLASNVGYADAGAAGNILALSSKGNTPECSVTYTGYLTSNDVLRVKLAASSGQDVATSWASLTVTYMGAASYFSQNGSNVFIAGGSNLGIGTSAPVASLDIRTTGASPLNVQSSSASQITYASLLSPNMNNITNYTFMGKSASASNCGFLNFTHVADNSSSNSMMMGLFGATSLLSINGLGNVGIGTTVPTGMLDVNAGLITTSGAPSSAFRLRTMPVANVKTQTTFGIDVGSIGSGLLDPARVDFKLSSTASGSNIWGGMADTTVMTMTGAGRIGIGITTPDALFQVNDASSGLPSTANSIIETARYSTNVVGNICHLRHYTRRYTAGSDWLSSSMRIQAMTDVTNQGYIEFNPPNGSHGIAFGVNSNEYMRMSQNGNIAIGSTTVLPTYNGFTTTVLHVAGTNANNGTDYYGSSIVLSRAGVGYAGMIGYKFDGSVGNSALQFHAGGADVTTSAPKMVVRESGNVGIGTTNPGTTMDVNGNLTVRGGVINTFATGLEYAYRIERAPIDFRIAGSVDANIQRPIAIGRYASDANGGAWTTTCSINSYSGNITNLNNSYGSLSDEALKENIAPARNYLDDMLKVNVVKYSLKSDGLSAPNQLGVIAQEVEQVFPNLIELSSPIENDQGEQIRYKTVKYSVFVPMLIKTVQELNNKIQNQDVVISQLLSRLEQLEQRIA